MEYADSRFSFLNIFRWTWTFAGQIERQNSGILRLFKQGLFLLMFRLLFLFLLLLCSFSEYLWFLWEANLAFCCSDFDLLRLTRLTKHLVWLSAFQYLRVFLFLYVPDLLYRWQGFAHPGLGARVMKRTLPRDGQRSGQDEIEAV